MENFDLVIIGSGSGNSLIDERFEGLRIAMVERGTYGGTCLNVGCIPTKMFVLPADHAVAPAEAARIGVDLELGAVHFPEIRDRIFGRIDPISAGGKQWREQSSNVTVFTGTGHFVEQDVLEVQPNDGGEPVRIRGERFVLANGSRPVLPEIPGLDDPAVAARVHTSDTVMRLDELPKSMVVMGGGYIAAEFAHVFSAYGTHVTLVNRSERLLRREDDEVAERFTTELGRRVELALSQEVQRFEPTEGGVVVVTRDADGRELRHTAEQVLVALGRVPNGDTLALENTAVRLDDGYVVVDEHQRTTQPNIWALGDVCSPMQLKHVANNEMRAVQANLLHEITGDGQPLASSSHRFVPHAIFSDPQIASVGATEQELRSQGVSYISKVQAYGDVAYGWAMEDDRSFVKLLADPSAQKLLGAHVIGPQASTLIQPLVQAMTFGLGIREMAREQYWIHPALTEVIENALLGLVEQAEGAGAGA